MACETLMSVSESLNEISINRMKINVKINGNWLTTSTGRSVFKCWNSRCWYWECRLITRSSMNCVSHGYIGLDTLISDCCCCCCSCCCCACIFNMSMVGSLIKICWYCGSWITPLTNDAPWNGLTTLTGTNVDVWLFASNKLDWFVVKLDKIEVIESSAAIVLVIVAGIGFSFREMGVDIWLGWNVLSWSDWASVRFISLVVSVLLVFCLDRNSSG